MRRFVLVCALVAGCGGDDDGGGGSLTIEELPDAIISTACNLYVRCGLVDDLATCRSLDLDFEFDPELAAAVNNGTVIFHEDEARACIAALGGATCAQNSVFAESDACDRTFEGTVAAGGACFIDEQCISQNCSVTSCPDACCAGTCVGDAPPVTPGLGESCAQTFRCANSYCDSATQICMALRTTGETCVDNDECTSGYCNGVCMELPGPGESCVATDGECRDIGYVCSQSTGTCEPFGLTGDPCTPNGCSPIYTCGTDGTCQLGPRLGEPCGPDADCIDTSYCEPTTLRCTAPKADGQPCESSSECQGDCDFDTGLCATDPVCI